MRRLIAAIISLLFFLMLITVLNTETEDKAGIPAYGDADLSSRVSERFVTKSVNGYDGEIVYGVTSDAETGSANLVTSIVVNYRSFDTLGEVTVLFISATGVGLLLGGGKKRIVEEIKVSPVARLASRIVTPLLLTLGIYVFIHGHLTPGGGFPGGAIIAAAFLLMMLTDEKRRAPSKLKVLEGSMGLTYVLLGVAGLLISGSFLQNFLPSGTIGELLSGGLVPVVYSVIGLKVGAELSGILDDLACEGSDES